MGDRWVYNVNGRRVEIESVGEFHECLDENPEAYLCISIPCAAIGIALLVFTTLDAINDPPLFVVVAFVGFLALCCSYAVCQAGYRTCDKHCWNPPLVDLDEQERRKRRRHPTKEDRKKDEEWSKAVKEGKLDEYLKKVEEGRGKEEGSAPAADEAKRSSELPRPSRPEDYPSHKAEQGPFDDVPKVGNRITISWAGTELDGRRGTIVGEKNKAVVCR